MLPDDVANERRIAREVIDELKAQFAAELDIEVIGCEDVPAGLHPQGPQGQIDAHLRFDECDFVIGIFWTRFGEPSENGHTPTEHEVRLAFEARKRQVRPQLLLYFSNQPYSAKTRKETEQRDKVLQFRDEFRKEGLCPSYENLAEFKDMLRSHLASYLQQEVTTKPALDAERETWFCGLSTSPRVVRAEGITELLSVIELLVEGKSPGKKNGPFLRFDIQVSLNVNVTNRRVADQLSDAMLVLDDGLVLPARIVANNSVVFEGVPICRTGALVRRQARIINLRANASQLCISPPSDRIQAFVSLTGPTPLTVLNKVVPVGLPRPAGVFSVEGPSTEKTAPFRFQRPEDRNERLAHDPPSGAAITSFTVAFRAKQPYAFRNRFQEQSTHGTRLVVIFFEVPSHVHVLVSTRDLGRPHSTSPRASLLFDTDVNGAPVVQSGELAQPVATSVQAQDVPLARLPVRGGFCLAVWEWVCEDSASLTQMEEVRFAVVLSVEPGQRPEGLLHVRGTLGPLSVIVVAGDSAPVPRFVDFSNATPAFVFD